MEQVEAVAAPAVSALQTGKIPVDVPQRYLEVRREKPETARLVYYPALLAHGRLHFVRASYQVDHWEQRWLMHLAKSDLESGVWESAEVFSMPLNLHDSAAVNAEVAPVVEALTVARNYDTWQRKLKDVLYRTQILEIFKCAELKEYSEANEREDDFRIRLTHRLHEERDEKVKQLRDRFAARMRRSKNVFAARRANSARPSRSSARNRWTPPSRSEDRFLAHCSAVRN